MRKHQARSVDTQLRLQMSLREWVHASQQRHGSPASRLWYYMQADLPESLLRDVDLRVSPLDALFGFEATSGGARSSSRSSERSFRTSAPAPRTQHSNDQAMHGGQGMQRRLRVSQQPRLWLSPRGAVSPMHYDTSRSFLAQVSGTKRVVFVPPAQLPLLCPFPAEHMLARRASVAVTRPAADRERLAWLEGREVVLGPGDAVLFGPYWSHWAASEAASCSVTCRFSH